MFRQISAVLGTIFTLGSAHSADSVGQHVETFTEGWSGQRKGLEESGFKVEGGYKADVLRVTSGGLKKGGKPMGQLDLKLTADLEKIADWSGTSIYINYIHDHGDTVNADHVGSLQGVSNVEVPVDTYRFFHAWIQKEWDDGRASLLAGLYPIDSEFQTLESGGIFVQPPYGPTAELALTRGPSIFNTSAVGIRARWHSENREAYAQGAILDGVPGDPDHPKGTHVKFGKEDGTMSIVEVGYKPKTLGDEKDDDRIAKYAFGVWGYSEKGDDLVDVDVNGNPVKRRSQGAYVLAEKSVLKTETGFDYNVFGRYSVTDGDSTPLKNALSLGVFIKAPYASRPDDTMGLAVTRSETGKKYRAAQLAAGSVATSHETVWELTYRAAVTPWLFVQPLVQRYKNPGADASVAKASVAGARFEVIF